MRGDSHFLFSMTALRSGRSVQKLFVNEPGHKRSKVKKLTEKENTFFESFLIRSYYTCIHEVTSLTFVINEWSIATVFYENWSEMKWNETTTLKCLTWIELWLETTCFKKKSCGLRLPALRSHVIPNPRSAAARDPTATPPSALGPAEPLVECRSPRGSPAAPRPHSWNLHSHINILRIACFSFVLKKKTGNVRNVRNVISCNLCTRPQDPAWSLPRYSQGHLPQHGVLQLLCVPPQLPKLLCKKQRRVATRDCRDSCVFGAPREQHWLPLLPPANQRASRWSAASPTLASLDIDSMNRQIFSIFFVIWIARKRIFALFFTARSLQSRVEVSKCVDVPFPNVSLTACPDRDHTSWPSWHHPYGTLVCRNPRC